MKLSSLALEAFYAVSKTSNFSRAAKTLHITQSALSQRILNLEEQLETKLFIRDPSGARLSESGQVLLRYCQAQSALEEEALSRLGQSKNRKEPGLAGTIRIAGYSSVMRSIIFPRLSELVRKNPAIKIEAFVRELSELPALLRSGQADFIVLDRILESSELESRVLGEEEYVLVEAKRITGRNQIYLDHDPEDTTTRRFFELQGKRFPSGFRQSYLDDIYGILDGVASGWGRAVLPRHLIQNRSDLRVFSKMKPLRIPIVLHFYKQPYSSELFRNALQSMLRI